MIQIEIDKFKIKINNDNEIQVFPLNVIGYLINYDSEIVTLYDSYNKMIVLNALFNDLIINAIQATRDNINELLKDLFFINYYTKEESDDLLDNKADKLDVYTKLEVDTKLDTKQDVLISGISIKTINSTSILGSGNIEIEGGGSTVDAYTKAETDTKLDLKADKEAGKGLSSNDYTDAEKTKLARLYNYDDTAISKAITDEVTRATAAEAVLDATFDNYYDKEEINNKHFITDAPFEYSTDITRIKNEIQINSVAYTYSGIFAASNSGIYKLNDKTEWELHSLSGIKVNQISQSKDNYNSVYAATDFGIYKLNYTTMDKFVATTFPSGSYSALCVNYDDNLIVVGNNSIYTFNANVSSDEFVVTDSSVITTFGDKYSLGIDKLGNIYLACNSGVFKYDAPNKIWLVTNVTSGIFGQIYCDYENLYVPTNGGVYKLENDVFTLLPLVDTQVNSVCVCNEYLYAGCDDGTIHFFGKNNIFELASGNFGKVYSINKSVDNTIYCATESGIAKGNEYFFELLNEFEKGKYTYTSVDGNGNLYLASTELQSSYIVVRGQLNTYLRSSGQWVKHNYSDYYTKKEIYNKSEIESKLSIKLEKPILVEVNQLGNILTLTKDNNQYTQITSDNVSVILPIVDFYTEVHLFFAGVATSTLSFNTDVLWKEKMGTMKNNEVYELIFTYLNKINKWIAGYIKYE